MRVFERFQGMDAVVRQLEKHIEFEPEWETGFNLQLRLQDIITMFLDWAGTDVRKTTIKQCTLFSYLRLLQLSGF